MFFTGSDPCAVILIYSIRKYLPGIVIDMA